MAPLPKVFKDDAVAYFSGKKETFATVLVSILVRMYGTEVLNYDGATIQLELKDDLDIEIPRVIYDQLMGLITALTTDSVYKDAAVFDTVVSALNREGVVPDNEPPTVEDVAWAVAEISLNDPEPVGRPPDQPWGRKIRKYVEAVLKDEGLTIPPTVLGFAQGGTPGKDGTDDEFGYAGAWGAAQAQADEIDQIIEARAVMLIQQLQSLGIDINAEEGQKIESHLQQPLI